MENIRYKMKLYRGVFLCTDLITSVISMHGTYFCSCFNWARMTALRYISPQPNLQYFLISFHRPLSKAGQIERETSSFSNNEYL